MNLSARTALATVVLSCAAFATACSDHESAAGRVSPDVDVVSLSSALTIAPDVINGTYTSCAGMTDGTPWSAAPSAQTQLPYPALSVQTNDQNCVLSITDVSVSGTSFYATQPMVLDTTFQLTPAAFTLLGSGNASFFGNAKISTHGYETTFGMLFLVSDVESQVANVTVQPAPTSETGTVTTGELPAPDYTIDTSLVAVQMSPLNVITSASGPVVLTVTNVPATDYAIYPDQPAATIDGLDTLYATLQPVQVSGQIVLQASDLNLVGTDLSSNPAYRTIILRNHDSDSGLSSYELVTVAFAPGGT